MYMCLLLAKQIIEYNNICNIHHIVTVQISSLFVKVIRIIPSDVIRKVSQIILIKYTIIVDVATRLINNGYF